MDYYLGILKDGWLVNTGNMHITHDILFFYNGSLKKIFRMYTRTMHEAKKYCTECPVHQSTEFPVLKLDLKQEGSKSHV